LVQIAQRRLPPLFQLGRHQPVRWIDVLELPLRQRGLIAQPLKLLRVRSGSNASVCCERRGPLIRIEFH